MRVHGYSDRINHALAFAAKHYDQQVRRGSRLPYGTQSANVAVILTRYGCADTTVLAGIVLDAVHDFVRHGYSTEMLQRRLGDKFGAEVVECAAGACERFLDEDGVEMSVEERRQERLRRLGSMPDAARWVFAAETLHGAGSLLAELRRTVEPASIWNRSAAGRAGTIHWYRAVTSRLREVGFLTGITEELGLIVAALDEIPD
jgi:hypothetical protein